MFDLRWEKLTNVELSTREIGVIRVRSLERTASAGRTPL